MTVPKLRFPEFEDEWETVKFDKLVEFTGKKNSKNLPLESFSISNEHGFIPQEKQFEGCSSLQNADKSLYYIVTPNSFAYNPARINVGSIGYYEGKKDVIVSSLYEIFKTNDKLEDCFLQQWLKTNSFVKQIAKFQEGGVRQYYYFDKLCMSEISMPENIEEQQKIGSFFSEIDNFISLNEEKLTELQNLKKSLMQKMFPKAGETVPEIRFPGFEGEWETYNLENLCDLFTDGDWIEAKDQSDTGIRLIQTGNIGTTVYLDKENNKKWISEEVFKRLHCEEVLPGDILISRLPEPAGRACIVPELNTQMITAVDCTILRTSEKCKNEYLVQYLSTPQYFKMVRYFLGGGTRQRISRGNLSEIKIPLPKDMEEQQKIGSFFKELDNRIELQKQKIDEIKEYKKGLLQQMFC